MRGGSIPGGLLVVGAIAAVWLLALRPASHLGNEWQPAGLGVARHNSHPLNLFDITRSVFAGGAAEAQDRTGAGVAGPAAGAGQPAPRFSRVTIEPGKAGRFTGSGAPGTSVSVRINGKIAGTAEVGADGTWAMRVAALGSGDHRVVLYRADAAEDGVTAEGQEIRIAIPDSVRASEIVAFEDRKRGARNSTGEADGPGDVRIRDQAERLGREASREFDAFSRRQNEDAERKRIARQNTAVDDRDTSNGGADGAQDAGPMAAVSDWLSRASRDYFDFVVPELARKGPLGAQVTAKNMPPPERPHDAPAGEVQKPPLPDLGALVQRAQDWLRDAHRTYNDVVVKDLSRPSPQTLAREERKDAVEVAGPDASSTREAADDAEKEVRRQAELRRELDRQALEVARKAVSEKQERELREAETRRVDAEVAERRDAAERKRRVDELLAAREAQRRQAEETTRVERARQQEDERRAAERALADEDQRAEEERRAEEVRRREEARKQDETRKEEELLAKLDEDRRRAQAERQRAEAERAEAQRQAERDRQERVEAERVAQEDTERKKRLAAEALRRREAEAERLAGRQEREARDRLDARVGAVSERAQRVGELADEAGFGRRRTSDTRDKTSASGTSASDKSQSDNAAGPKDIPIADRKSVRVEQRSAPDEQRRRESRLKQQSERADTVARLAGDAGFGNRVAPSGVAIPLPADPSERREALRTASRLGGPERSFRTSRKNDPRPRETSDRPRRLAGWRGRAAPIGGTGCKDRRAGRSIRLPGTYVVAPGDTLWHISRRHYRRGLLYGRIYKANRRKIRDPHWIYPCQRFWLPRR